MVDWDLTGKLTDRVDKSEESFVVSEPGLERGKSTVEEFRHELKRAGKLDSTLGQSDKTDQGGKPEAVPKKTSPLLELHGRSEEIGRFIFTRPSFDSEVASVASEGVSQVSESMNESPLEFLAKFYGWDQNASDRMAEYMRETMAGLPSAIDATTNSKRTYTDAANIGAGRNDAIDKALNFSEINGDRASLDSKPIYLPLRDSRPEYPSEPKDLSDGRLNTVKEGLPIGLPTVLDQRGFKQLDYQALPSQLVTEGESAAVNSGHRSQDETPPSPRDNFAFRDQSSSRNETSDAYRNWKEKLTNLVQERISIAIREGYWMVRLNLEALGMDKLDVTLRSDGKTIKGEIYTKDLYIRDALSQSLGKLKKDLFESLGTEEFDEIEVKIVDKSDFPDQVGESGLKEIKVQASEFLASAAKLPKFDEGLDVFV